MIKYHGLGIVIWRSVPISCNWRTCFEAQFLTLTYLVGNDKLMFAMMFAKVIIIVQMSSSILWINWRHIVDIKRPSFVSNVHFVVWASIFSTRKRKCKTVEINIVDFSKMIFPALKYGCLVYNTACELSLKHGWQLIWSKLMLRTLDCLIDS